MPRRISFLAAFYTVCFALCLPAYTQDSPPDSQTQPCIFPNGIFPNATQGDNAPEVDVSIAEITFWGLGIQVSASEQSEIAATVKTATRHGNSVSDVVEEALGRVQMEWQDRGYWQVQVTGEAKTISSNPVSTRIAINVHVEEGLQYRLREITFKNNKLFTNVEALRFLFPIKDGDLLNRKPIQKGLESLNRAYASQGFINFIGIPEPNYDESNRLVSLVIDVDEGDQFYLGNIRLQGLDDDRRQKVPDSFLLKPGDVFNENLLQQSLDRQDFPDCSCDGVRRHIDVKRRTIDIALDFRPCT